MSAESAMQKFYDASDLKKELDGLDDSVGSLLKIMILNKVAGEFFKAGYEAGLKHGRRLYADRRGRDVLAMDHEE